VAVLVAAVALAPFAVGWWHFNRMARIEVGPVLTPAGAGTNYLVVGTDTREGIDPGSPDADAFLAGPTAGERADTIIVLRVGDGPARMLSIPRDLWVVDPVTGTEGRINATIQSGPAGLIQAVANLGVPVSHYVQVDFVSFAALIDAVGGIDLDFAHPAVDTKSGLNVTEAGQVRLTGPQAVAFVRSREYTEIINGVPVTDPTGDLGRTERQRAFLAALLPELGSPRNLPSLALRSGSVAPGVAVDDTLTYPGFLRFMWQARGIQGGSVELPVIPTTTAGGASVVVLNQPDADAVLATFR